MSLMRRRFGRAFKLYAVEQMAVASVLTALAVRLAVRGKLLYR